jgi:hypothetical protein
MKLSPCLALLLGLGLAVSQVACSKSDPTATTTSNAATVASGGTAAAPAAPAAPAKPAFVQKGVKPGKVVVGYMLDAADPAQCAVVTDDPAKKETFTKNADKLAAMMKAKVVASCPTDSVVGTCDVGMGMIANYSGPKWTAEAAKKDCTSKPRQVWLD